MTAKPAPPQSPGLREAASRALRWFEMANDGDMSEASKWDSNLIEDALRQALAAQSPVLPPSGVDRLRGSMNAQWMYDPEGAAYYFAPMQAAPGPYLTQRHVNAILDIASDGTLAGVELIDNVPPPPVAALSASVAGEDELTPDQVAYCRELADERRTAWAAHAAPSPALDPGTVECCAKIVDAEAERILSKQTLTTDPLSMTDTVNLNLRMMACVLPEISASIRALASPAPGNAQQKSLQDRVCK